MIFHLCTCTTLCFNTVENDSVSEAAKNEMGVSKCQSTENDKNIAELNASVQN